MLTGRAIRDLLIEYDVEPAMQKAYRLGYEAMRKRAAEVCRNVYGGRAHTYASENADIYRAQDGTIASCVKAIERDGKA